MTVKLLIVLSPNRELFEKDCLFPCLWCEIPSSMRCSGCGQVADCFTSCAHQNTLHSPEANKCVHIGPRYSFGKAQSNKVFIFVTPLFLWTNIYVQKQDINLSKQETNIGPKDEQDCLSHRHIKIYLDNLNMINDHMLTKYLQVSSCDQHWIVGIRYHNMVDLSVFGGCSIAPQNSYFTHMELRSLTHGVRWLSNMLSFLQPQPGPRTEQFTNSHLRYICADSCNNLFLPYWLRIAFFCWDFGISNIPTSVPGPMYGFVVFYSRASQIKLR